MRSFHAFTGCAAGVIVAGCLLNPTLAQATTWRLEAEGVTSDKAVSVLPDHDKRWQSRQVDQAGSQAALAGSAGHGLGESKGLAVAFPQAGTYSLWVRYRRGADDSYASFITLVRDDSERVTAHHFFDWNPRQQREQPYKPWEPAIRQDTQAGDWLWERMTFTVERPFNGSIHFGGLNHGPAYSARLIDCAILTDDADFRPDDASFGQIDEAPGHLDKLPPVKTPRGMRVSEGFPLHASFFSGVADPAKRFSMGMTYTAALYVDTPQFLELGFNTGHSLRGGDANKGIYVMQGADVHTQLDKAIAAKYPSPQGRVVNAEGQVGSQWSLSFQPRIDNLLEQTRTRISGAIDNPVVTSWRIAAESGGFMDYSEASVAHFRRWLRERYDSIAQLNERWGTDFAGFDDVTPAANPQENKASWFAFREFNGWVWADSVRQQAQAVRELDAGSSRKLLQQFSNLDLLAARFTSLRPMDWEEMINHGLEGIDSVAWDGYAIDDFMATEIDLLHSLAGGREVLNEEWNVHGQDPRLTARTFWTMIGKGLHGVAVYQWQQGIHHDSYPKWSMTNRDLTPKAKLGAVADAAAEVHRIEPLLMSARAVDVVKPVAIYYSRLDLSLAKPLSSAWGEGVNTPYHLYATLRGAGYNVRWITPGQITEGQLGQVAAVVLIDAQHVPAKAADTLAKWVEQGGAVIADGWPGAYDEYGRPQNQLAQVMGIRAHQPRRTGPSLIDLQQSSQGYGEVTISAISGSDLPSTVGELWQQWDATHPVAQKMGNYMLSGYGRTRVEAVSGHVVGMTFGGLPGVVINPHGQGQAMYVSMMLGSLYEGSATRFEANPTYAGMAYHRLLDAFLQFAGAEPAIRTDLPIRLHSKLRVERPLMDDRGNAIVGVVNLNDQPLCGFELQIQWPAQVDAPRQVLVSQGGSRALTPVSFDLTRHDGNRSTLTVHLPSVDTHATILALTDHAPLVALDVTGVQRGVAGLPLVQPGDTLTVHATVYNPSPRTLEAGQIQMWLPAGWFMDKAVQDVSSIAPGKTARVTFRVQAPALAGDMRLRPIVVKHRTKQGVESTPATEQLWWNRQADSPF